MGRVFMSRYNIYLFTVWVSPCLLLMLIINKLSKRMLHTLLLEWSVVSLLNYCSNVLALYTSFPLVLWQYVVCCSLVLWQYVVCCSLVLWQYVVCCSSFLWQYVVCCSLVLWQYLVCCSPTLTLSSLRLSWLLVFWAIS